VRGIWRKPVRNVVAEGHKIETFKHDRWARPMGPGDIVPAVVTAVDAKETRNPVAHVRFGKYTAELTKTSYQWTRRTQPSELVKPGDLIDIGITRIDDAGKVTISLEQQPILEGALVALDNRTGQILAMVGGFNF